MTLSILQEDVVRHLQVFESLIVLFASMALKSKVREIDIFLKCISDLFIMCHFLKIVWGSCCPDKINEMKVSFDSFV